MQIGLFVGSLQSTNQLISIFSVDYGEDHQLRVGIRDIEQGEKVWKNPRALRMQACS